MKDGSHISCLDLTSLFPGQECVKQALAGALGSALINSSRNGALVSVTMLLDAGAGIESRRVSRYMHGSIVRPLEVNAVPPYPHQCFHSQISDCPRTLRISRVLNNDTFQTAPPGLFRQQELKTLKLEACSAPYVCGTRRCASVAC